MKSFSVHNIKIGLRFLFLAILSFYSLNIIAQCGAPASITPGTGNVCDAPSITATINPPAGQAGCTFNYQISNNGGAWGALTPTTIPINISTAGWATVAIRAQTVSCTAPGCAGAPSAFITVTWTVLAQPVAQTLTRNPNIDSVCVGKVLTVVAAGGSGGAGVVTNQFRRYNAAWNAWAGGAAPSFAAVLGADSIQSRRTATGPGCVTSSVNSVAWRTVPLLVAPAMTKSPTNLSVCAGQTLTVTNTPGTGGFAPTVQDEFRYSSNNGGVWSGWSTSIPSFAAVTSANNFIQGRRYINEPLSGCTTSASSQVAWTPVVAQPAKPTLNTKTPNLPTVCTAIGNVRASINAGTGGTGCTDTYQYEWDASGTWNAYVSNANISTALPHTKVRIRVSRGGCTAGSGCIGTAIDTIATWDIVTNPAAPALTKNPLVATVCAGTTLTATVVAGTGGYAPTVQDEFRYSTNNGGVWSGWNTSVPSFAAVVSANNYIQGRRFINAPGSGCATSASSQIAWPVVAQPLLTLVKAATSNYPTVCAGKTVQAILNRSGGTGCTDTAQYRLNGVGVWNNFVVGGMPATLSVPTVAGVTLVEMRASRGGCTGGSGCTGTALLTLSWNLVPQPTRPSLNTATPNLPTVCRGEPVSAIFNAGANGVYCNDTFQYRFNPPNVWTPYVPGTDIPTAGKTSVNIQLTRWRYVANTGCNTPAWQTVKTWTVNAQPTWPTLNTKTPNIPSVCQSATYNVRASYNAGTGGYLCTDSVQRSYDGSGIWVNYPSNQNIPTAGHTLIEIRGCRKNCAAGAGCTETPWNPIASWIVVTQPTSPTLNAKTPDVMDVCSGTDVSAIFNAGTGGVGCGDIYRYAYDGTAVYTAYNPGDPITTTGHTLVIIQGQRSGCPGGTNCTASAWVELARWNVLALPTGPTLNNKSPDLTGVCNGKTVWANFIPGSGGAGCSDVFEYSYDNSGTWIVYIAGNNISSTGHTLIEIRGYRTGCNPGCGGTLPVTIASWNVVPQPTSPTLNVKTPNLPTVCRGLNVSATFNAGSGGVSCADTFQYRYNGAGVWTGYTPGSNIPTTGYSLIEIRGQRYSSSLISGCTSSLWVTLASWTAIAQPINPTLLAKIPALSGVCDGEPVSATFNAGSGGSACSDVFEYEYDGSGTWTVYVSGNIITTGHTLVRIRGERTNCTAGAGCTSSGPDTLATWTVEAMPAVPAINVRTPDIATVCAGKNVSATFTAGTGGVGCTDQFQYQFDGAGAWTSYTPGTNIGTAGHTSLVIEGQRVNCSAGSGCTPAIWALMTSWNIALQPVGPTLNIKTPLVTSVCDGQDVSATFLAGSGGVTCSDTFNYRYDGIGAWTLYTPGNNISTVGHTLVEIQGRRSGCDPLAGCTSTAWVTLTSWTVVPQPIAPTLNIKTPNINDVCDFISVSATFTSGSGGVSCTDEYEYRYDGAGLWAAYTPNSNISTAGHTLIEIQGRRSNCAALTGCNASAWALLTSWNILAQPVAPALLAKTPNLASVCVGTDVSATVTAGSGGVTCSDQFRYRYDGTGTWNAYTPGNNITTTGHTLIEIQGQRGGCDPIAGCISTAWVSIATWTIEALPTSPTLNARTPNFASVCEGQTVSATFYAGSGGFGCTDQYQYQYDGAGGWTAYTPGNPIITTGHTSLVIQGQRAGCTAGSGCTSSAWIDLASWTIVAQPIAPTLNVATPNAVAVCSGQTVSATFNAGTGGSGCTDQYQYRYNGSGMWSVYTPGNNLNTAGYTSVEIQAARTGCSAGTGCTGTAWATLISWTITAQPTAPSLNAITPDLPGVCDGQDVSATFNAGAGGVGCSDAFEYSYDNSGTWNAYIAGNNISTSGHTKVEIHGQRANCTAGIGCTGTAWVTLASWTVQVLPSAPTLNTKNPALDTVCVGKMVSASFNAGSGGIGCSDQYQYQFDAAGWLTYVPGNNLNTTGHTLVEIRTQRTNCTAGAGCTGTAWDTLASWIVEPQPGSPTLNVKTPNQASVCDGQNVAATFNAGTGGSGCDDLFEYRYDAIGAWTSYTPGDSISALGHNLIEIRGQRSACNAGANCVGTPWGTLVSWIVNPQPNGPTINVKTPNLVSVCEGYDVSATFIPGSGGVNCTDQFEYSYDSSGTWVAYTGGTLLSTTGHTYVEIHGNRSGCTAGCSGSPWVVLAGWAVILQPVDPTLNVLTPNLTDVCEGDTVSATYNAGSEGIGCTDQHQCRYDNIGIWSTYLDGQKLNTNGHTKVEIQSRRGGCTASTGCSNNPFVITAAWNVIPKLVAPKLNTKIPNQASVCDSQLVSATVDTGSGGTGCTDQLEYEFDLSGTWNPYNSGDSIDVSGHTSLVVRGKRGGCTTCTETAWMELATWTINPIPVAPALSSKTPNTDEICAGQPASAIFIAGSGGVGCADQLQYSFDSSGTWSNYTSGSEIKTDDHSFLEIRGSRNGCSTSCTNTDTTVYASWTLIPQPTYPVLTAKTPDATAICENIPVSATFDSGIGGVGSVDMYRYSYDNADNWTTYNPGDSISALGRSRIDLQGMRTSGADSAGCAIKTWKKYVTWYVNPIPTIISTMGDSACVASPMILKATASTMTSMIHWYDSLAGGTILDSSYSDIRFFTPQIITTVNYYAEAKDHGCSSSPRVLVSAKILDCDDIQKDSIPNLFSPNGDGYNDKWVFDLTYHPEAIVQVYNRWGQMVWISEKGYINPWDGNNKSGQKAPEEGYHYVIIENGKTIKTGGVVLIR